MVDRLMNRFEIYEAEPGTVGLWAPRIFYAAVMNLTSFILHVSTSGTWHEPRVAPSPSLALAGRKKNRNPTHHYNQS